MRLQLVSSPGGCWDRTLPTDTDTHLAGNYPVRVREETRTTPPAAGDGLIRAGAVVFIVGAVASLVTIAPLFLGTKPFPTYMFGLSLLMGVGFLIAGIGVLRSIAAGRRQARGDSR